MSDVKLDSTVFFSRAKKLFDIWDVSSCLGRLEALADMCSLSNLRLDFPSQNASGDTATLGEIAAIQVLVGDASDDAPAFVKSAALQVRVESY